MKVNNNMMKKKNNRITIIQTKTPHKHNSMLLVRNPNKKKEI